MLHRQEIMATVLDHITINLRVQRLINTDCQVDVSLVLLENLIDFILALVVRRDWFFLLGRGVFGVFLLLLGFFLRL